MQRLASIAILALLILVSACKRNERHLVISKIRGTAKLATTETRIDKVVVGEKTKKFLGLVKIGDADFVAYSEATVKTGVNLTKLREEDVKIEGNRITISFPAVEVLDFSYPFNKFRVDTILSNNSFLAKIDVIEQEYFFRLAELDIRKNLRYTGIIEQTQVNTRKLMEGMLKNLGYEEIYVNFRDSSELIQQVVVDPTPAQQEADQKADKKKD